MIHPVKAEIYSLDEIRYPERMEGCSSLTVGSGMIVLCLCLLASLKMAVIKLCHPHYAFAGLIIFPVLSIGQDMIALCYAYAY